MGIFFDFLIKIYKAIYLFAYDNTGNYGLALVLLSLFTYIVLYPFNKKAKLVQNKEYKIQSILVPQINAIKKQYCGHEQYEQLQWLYRRYGYHPLYAIRSATGLFLQIPFLTAAYYMLSGLVEIQGVSWGVIPNLGSPDHLLGGINVLPFVMTVVTVFYTFVIPKMSQKERLQTVAIGFFFLVLLYNAPSALIIFWSCNLLWSLLDTMLSGKLAWLGNWYYENELALVIHITCNPLLNHFSTTDGKSINPLSYRDIKLYANQNLAGSWRFTSIDTATVSCKISVNIVKDLKLNLGFSIVNPPNSNQPELFQINKIWIEQN